ncbi:PREDICTED: uncharacterized protein LOC109218713 [Nicotiana attenuata]|uniref:uncharacterized protein LOC109218713 n=1 Tax=Nicotiana attenuata TaxID=49451 RepID=UPI00090560CA|nr:PREDICTED: uncharacterized protein LOC109218713 [Nicotiana attenuata]
MDTPKPNIYKLNTGGAHSSTLTTDGIGGLIRNHNGDWIVGFSGNIPCQSSISAELYALIQGLRIAIQQNLSPLHVEVDAKEVITMLDCDNIIYANLLFDCRHLLLKLRNPRVHHAYREQSRVADQLARSILEGNFTMRVFDAPPLFVRPISEADKQGQTIMRSFPSTPYAL